MHIPQKQTESIQSMFYLNDKALIKSGMKGIAFNSNSDFSKRLSTSKEFQTAINQDIYQKNKTEKEPYLIIDFQKDKNLHLSIGHGRVIYRLTNDGYVEGCLFDKYDFDLIRSKYTFDNNGIIMVANNYSYFRSFNFLLNSYKYDLNNFYKNFGIYFANDYAYLMNQCGHLEYYYYTVDFKFKLNK